MLKGKIHSFESFGTVDGPGIRYVVFFQGCPLRCKYCHNPDTWDMMGGRLVGTDEIIQNFERNRAFYKSGGITVTGGEAMMQLDFLTELFEKAKMKNIHTCLDTSGICFRKEDAESGKFARLMKVCDLVILDIKCLDEEEHKWLTGLGNRNVLDFADYLEKNEISFWVRHVVVPGITFQKELLFRLGSYLKKFSCLERIELLSYHTMGTAKYSELGLAYPLESVPALSEEEKEKAESYLARGLGLSD